MEGGEWPRSQKGKHLVRNFVESRIFPVGIVTSSTSLVALNIREFGYRGHTKFSIKPRG